MRKGKNYHTDKDPKLQQLKEWETQGSFQANTITESQSVQVIGINLQGGIPQIKWETTRVSLQKPYEPSQNSTKRLDKQDEIQGKQCHGNTKTG